MSEEREKLKTRENLSVRELLEEVYIRLRDLYSGQEIILPTVASVEIADDSDWHRTAKGFMTYTKAVLLKFGQTTWVLSRGERGSGYPARPYGGDLLAVKAPSFEGKTPDLLSQELKEIIESPKNSYFRSSLLIGLADGTLAVNEESVLARRISEPLRSRIPEFIAQKLEIDSKHFYIDVLRPVVKSPMRYKPEFVDFLVELIPQVLTKT